MLISVERVFICLELRRSWSDIPGHRLGEPRESPDLETNQSGLHTINTAAHSYGRLSEGMDYEQKGVGKVTFSWWVEQMLSEAVKELRDLIGRDVECQMAMDHEGFGEGSLIFLLEELSKDRLKDLPEDIPEDLSEDIKTENAIDTAP